MTANDRVLDPAVPVHIGMVVRDVEQSVRFLSSIWGPGTWTTFEYGASGEQVRFGTPFQLKIAGTRMGPLGIELIQPVESPDSVWARYMEKHGEGMHHIAFKVNDLEKTVSGLKERGGKVLAAVSPVPGMNWCYIEVTPGGIILEIMNFDLPF